MKWVLEFRNYYIRKEDLFCVANEGLGKRNPQQVAGGQICNFCKFGLHGETCSWNVADE